MPPKTALDKVVAAIEAIEDPQGASRQAIAKQCKAAFGWDLVARATPASLTPPSRLDNAVALKKALKKGIDSGRLVHGVGSARFGLPGVVYAPPVEEEPQIEVLAECPEYAPPSPDIGAAA